MSGVRMMGAVNASMLPATVGMKSDSVAIVTVPCLWYATPIQVEMLARELMIGTRTIAYLLCFFQKSVQALGITAPIIRQKCSVKVLGWHTINENSNGRYDKGDRETCVGKAHSDTCSQQAEADNCNVGDKN